MQIGAQYLQYLQDVANRLAKMSDSEVIVGLVAMALLSGYLLIRHLPRVIQRPRVLDSALWPGKPIDVSKLKPMIEGVRLNYLKDRHPSQSLPFRRSLLALARRTVTRLAYFQRLRGAASDRV